MGTVRHGLRLDDGAERHQTGGKPRRPGTMHVPTSPDDDPKLARRNTILALALSRAAR